MTLSSPSPDSIISALALRGVAWAAIINTGSVGRHV